MGRKMWCEIRPPVLRLLCGIGVFVIAACGLFDLQEVFEVGGRVVRYSCFLCGNPGIDGVPLTLELCDHDGCVTLDQTVSAPDSLGGSGKFHLLADVSSSDCRRLRLTYPASWETVAGVLVSQTPPPRSFIGCGFKSITVQYLP